MKRNKELVQIYLQSETKEEVTKVAEKKGISRNALLTIWIEKMLEQDKLSNGWWSNGRSTL